MMNETISSFNLSGLLDNQKRIEVELPVTLKAPPNTPTAISGSRQRPAEKRASIEFLLVVCFGSRREGQP
jgi:hypothetical protein